jgi:hypothetical protein
MKSGRRLIARSIMDIVAFKVAEHHRIEQLNAPVQINKKDIKIISWVSKLRDFANVRAPVMPVLN